MICYFDTSALVPLLITEPSSEVCRRLWDDADAVVTARLAYVEAAAALGQAARLRRVTSSAHRAARRILDQLWLELDVVEIDDGLVRRAAELARSHALRGYDAMHCACAEQLLDSDLVVSAGDRDLLRACTALGLATADVHA
ncbi:MAG TPA: type II toxin-antitoxin system VapC family toxin [Jatrophihabitantaceae bacterium]